jgi:hypothetical protein
MAAGPVVDAQVLLWWVDGNGHPLTREGRRSRQAGLSPENALAEGHTDQQGAVELPLGPAYGMVVLAARGGWTHDPWMEPPSGNDGGPPCTSCDASPGAPDGGGYGPSEIPVDIELRSVLIDFVPGPASRDVVITPLTTLATAIGEHRQSPPFRVENYYQAMTRAFALLGRHFGGPGAGIDIARGPIPTSTDQPLPGLTPGAMQVLAIQGMASLAHRMAEASSVSGRSFHLLDLLAALLQDIADGNGFLDGLSLEGDAVVVGGCPVPEGCTADDPACHPVCRLDANTLRGHLASAVAFDFLPSPLNQTTLILADVRPFLEHMQNSVELELFDSAEPGELDSPEPLVEVIGSMVLDERLDVITFAEDAVPVHTAGENAVVDLGQAAVTCPVVGKHVHRLADPDANPLRWQIVARDRTGWPASEDFPVSLEYRVRRRDPESLPGSAGACSVDPEQAWLTDWLPAQPIESMDDGGVLYEVTLLRGRLPALATELQAEFEIVFRGRDALEQEVVACRCWNHVLLPAPLEVGDITVATGPGSLAARSLHPGNNIAPLLNGVPLEEAPALASFLIRNGTDEPAYVRFSVTQPLVHYTKCWRRSNAELSINVDPDPQCVVRGECLSNFPPDRQSVVAVESGIIGRLVTGLRLQDISTLSSTTAESCAECDVPEHSIAPRFHSKAPRIYRVDLLITDLVALAPRTAVEPPSFYFETGLAPPYLTPITGVIAADILHVCTSFDAACDQTSAYQYYRLIAAAKLIMDEPLSVHIATAPLSRIPQQATRSISTELESFAWSTHEPNLPYLIRPSAIAMPQPCPIADGNVP